MQKIFNEEVLLSRKDEVKQLIEFKNSVYFETLLKLFDEVAEKAKATIISSGTRDIKVLDEQIATVRVVERFKRMFSEVDKTYEFITKIEHEHEEAEK